MVRDWGQRRALAGLPLPDAEHSVGPARRRRAPATTQSRPSLRRFVSSPPRLLSTTALLAIGLVAAHFALAQRYVVSGPIVMGNQRVPAAAIRAAAEIDGARLFRLDRATVAARVAALPDIDSARVAARLPNQVWIEVRETRPAIKWLADDGMAVIDSDGRAVSGAVATDGLIIVHDRGGPAPAPGDQLPSGLVNIALQLAPLFERLEHRPGEGFVGVTAAGWEVRLGTDPRRAARQADLLAAIQRHLAPMADRVALVDLRFDRPYYRLHGGQGGND